jgi:hypothetical protein
MCQGTLNVEPGKALVKLDRRCVALYQFGYRFAEPA